MKNLYKPLLISTVILFTLAACNNQTANNVTGEPIIESESENIGLRYGSGLRCDQLRGEENRQNCEVQMSELVGSMLEQEILSTFDSNRCQELPSPFAENCESTLAESGVNGPVSQEEILAFSEALRGTFPETDLLNETDVLFPTYDSSKCSILTTPGYKEYCESQIAQQVEQITFDQIIQSGNAGRCDELKKEELMVQCRAFLGENSGRQ